MGRAPNPEAVSRPADSSSVQVPRLVLAYLDRTNRLLVCGFEGGSVLSVPVGKLGLSRGFKVAIAAPDEFRAGVILVGEEGQQEHIAADFLFYLTEPRYRAQFDPADGRDLGARVGSRLRAIRRRLALSQRAMASRLGMAPPNYARLEMGKHVPSVRTLVRLAETLDIPLGRLVTSRKV